MERRRFIKNSTAVAAGTAILPVMTGTATAAARALGASDKIVVGAIGINGMGFSNLRSFLKQKGDFEKAKIPSNSKV